MRADEHVHQRTLAHGQAERVAKQAARTPVGQRLETLLMDRQGMNARPKRPGRRNRRRQRFRRDATLATALREAAMTHDIARIEPVLPLGPESGETGEGAAHIWNATCSSIQSTGAVTSSIVAPSRLSMEALSRATASASSPTTLLPARA